ncbi:YbjN domain-containing protein [Plantactinospora sp. WMMB334]|uniref:YbjN domain-containing protein n=1 Tax=Plantactinospora sp. WMMB334 TaxID=3404119 RepID=UPI003B92E81C
MSPDRLLAALADARDQPDGAAKMADLDRIVAYADAAGDVRVGVAARLVLVEVKQRVEPWRMLPAVQWCLAAADRTPGVLDPVEIVRLRRHHRTAVAALCGTSRIGLTRTGAALDGLERRLGSAGQSRRPVYALRCRIADHIGAEATARRWLARWRAAPVDDSGGCADCEAADQARLLVGWGCWTEALEIVAPLLAGTYRCPDQPERALGTIQLAYLRLGRYDEAGDAHVRAYRRHRRERDGLPFLADHLRFCALAGHHGRGLEILARHLPALDQPYDEASALEFAAAGALLCRLAGADGFARYPVHRPGYAQRHAADLSVAALGAELTATAEDLAGRFDARNGTGHQSGRIAGWLAERRPPGAALRPLPADPPPDDEWRPPDDEWVVADPEAATPRIGQEPWMDPELVRETDAQSMTDAQRGTHAQRGPDAGTASSVERRCDDRPRRSAR